MHILIVDDHPLVCSGIRNILLSEQSISNIMQANDIQTAMGLMSLHSFNLVLVDMRLKNECGVDLILAAKVKYPDCRFVILSSSSAAVDFDRAMHAGVDGYILKDAFPEDIVYAVKTVLRGKKYFDPVFYEKTNTNHQTLTSVNSEDLLSPREAEILNCLGKGLPNKSIANKLFISENTVKKHVSSILTKLNLSDRTQAALYISKSLDRDI
jgi:two-component system, NarL family, nitrate/nitrite response regulator NarL